MQEDIEFNEEINQERQSTLTMLENLKKSFKFLPPMLPLEEQNKFNKSKKTKTVNKKIRFNVD